MFPTCLNPKAARKLERAASVGVESRLVGAVPRQSTPALGVCVMAAARQLEGLSSPFARVVPDPSLSSNHRKRENPIPPATQANGQSHSVPQGGWRDGQGGG